MQRNGNCYNALFQVACVHWLIVWLVYWCLLEWEIVCLKWTIKMTRMHLLKWHGFGFSSGKSGLFSTLIWCFTSDANKTATSQFVLWCTKKYSNEFRHMTLFQPTSATLYAKQSLHSSFCLISESLCVTIIDFFLSSYIRCDHYLWTLFSCTACYYICISLASAE